ncbi:MAG TPA: PEP-CTERM sorting domain-containing protein [Tepidisphaeraceae bacterium]|nr:PEP-CTERM sorting domain-containing protein [Tepidisphaeraceae bacterium]
MSTGVVGAFRGAAVVVVVCAVPALGADAAPRFTARDLTPPTSAISGAYAMSSAGDVVGIALSPTGDRYMFVDRAGVRSIAAAPAGAHQFRPTGINASGLVIGQFHPSPSSPQPVSFVSSAGVVTPIAPLGPRGGSGDGWIYATSINDAGDIVGRSTTASSDFEHLFRYRDGQNTDLGGEVAISAYVNNTGVIAADRFVNGSGSWPYRYANGGGATILSVGNTVTGISHSGLIVGALKDTLASAGYLYDPTTGQKRTIDTLGGPRTLPNGVNSEGWVVGTSDVTGGLERAFFFDRQRGPVDLNTLVDGLPAGTILTSAVAVNDAGQVAVNGTVNGAGRSFLLTPVPEPGAAVGLAAVGSWALARRHPRRPGLSR